MATAALVAAATLSGLVAGRLLGWWLGCSPGCLLGCSPGCLLGCLLGAAAAPRRRLHLALAVCTAAVFGALACRFGASWTLPAELSFAAGALALAACDLDRLILPKRAVAATGAATAGWLVAAALAGGSGRRLAVAGGCGLVAFACFFAVNWVRPAWLGFGDVRLAGVVGLALGWVGPGCVLLGFVAANLFGLAVGVALVVAGRATRRSPLPYGAFLAAGAVVALIGTGVG